MHVFWLKLLRYMRFFEEFDLTFQDFKEKEKEKERKFIIVEKNIWRI